MTKKSDSILKIRKEKADFDRQEENSQKQKLRNAEYYDMQSVFDKLYTDSKKDLKFTNLVEIIKSSENIRLAYRNMRKNKGSKTAGTDKRR